MSQSRLRDLKKNITKTQESEFHPYIIAGQHFFALAAFYKLNELYPDKVRLVAPRLYNHEDACLRGPNSLRGEHNIAALTNLGYSLEEFQHTPLFYKDQKLREFGGRARPETLLYGEEFYGQRPYQFNPEEFFPFLTDSFFVNKANQNLKEGQIVKISKCVPSDLIDRAFWKLEMASGPNLICEHLIWAGDPVNFLKYFEKEGTSSEIIQILESTRTPISLYVRLEFEKAVTTQAATLFLPLSFTHEWGHFVGEFKTVNGKQQAEFITTVDEENNDEAHIANIIRILKKNLEKVVPTTTNLKMKEFIMLSERTPCLKFDDRAFLKSGEQLKNLFFVGMNAFLNESLIGKNRCEDSGNGIPNVFPAPTHLVRALLSLRQFC